MILTKTEGNVVNDTTLLLPGCNRCHTAIADTIIDEFKDFEVTSEAIESIIQDFGFGSYTL